MPADLHFSDRDQKVALGLEALELSVAFAIGRAWILSYVYYDGIDDLKAWTEAPFSSGVMGFIFILGFSAVVLFSTTILCIEFFAVIMMGLWKLERALLMPFVPALTREREYNQAISKWEKECKRLEELKRQKRLEYWRGLDGRSLEHACANLFTQLGLRAEVTPGSNDRGVDIVLKEPDGIARTVVECKTHTKPIGVGVLRGLHAAKQDFGADRAWVVALAGVTKSAEKHPLEHGIRVINVNALIQMSPSGE